MKVLQSVSCILFVAFVSHFVGGSEDFYKVLNISKDATNRELRKAFKKAALEYHPDKNKDDPEAHNKFLLINRAYETLKDPDLRKRYDLFGEESGSSGNRRQYQSWSYYHDNFGIYDDDPEIITLDRTEFEQTVVQADDIWFINFYSPGCSHCHDLAPEWRRMARELENVIRVGAVNCAEERSLCRQQGIHGYPTLLFYPERERYEGDRIAERLVRHVLRRLSAAPIDVDASNVAHLSRRSAVLAERPWLLFFEGGEERPTPASEDTRLKVAAMMDGVVNVGQVSCAESELCDTLQPPGAVVYYPAGEVTADSGQTIDSLDAQEIAAAALRLLPPLPTLTEEEYQSMRASLRKDRDGGALPWLVELAADLAPTMELVRLPTLLASTSFARLDCSTLAHLCKQLHVSKYPAFVLFKPAARGGGYELFHGRATAHRVAAFARDAAAASLSVLGPEELESALRDGQPRVVDFFAPWCPPCMRLMPELRKASAQQSALPFGSVDCTAHAALCSRYNIRSYPTVIVYNKSEPHVYRGPHTADGLLDFIEDTLRPAVVALNDHVQQELARRRPADQLWVIDFYAGWCGPCVQFAPEYRRAARLLKQHNVPAVVAMVDCAEHRTFCAEQDVRSYPTVRLYRPGKGGLHSYSVYSGHRDAESLLDWTLRFLPDPVTELAESEFVPRVLDGPGPWLVDFYTPWCGHCQMFAPKFQLVARSLEGEVRCGKVDCQQYPRLCQNAGVRAYPTLKVYEGGGRLDMVGTEVVSLEPEKIVRFVRGHLVQAASGQRRSGQAGERQPRDEL
ncbi:DnaJ subfamily C member 10 [Amphibalanus amphitrite]|uniref:DnaJ homolog subfamily C member 10 n=1 Tax=Amphibalanus amphitrite TaxID=1232801 RepID=A0A6A4VPC4_AMPAM|nr:DnaJ subfamily C member 10 [Amphibalanus amphitrite]